MKVTIDPTMKDLTPEEAQELIDQSKSVEDHPEEAKAAVLQAKDVVFSPQVLKQMEEMGITPDELVAMLLKAAGASQ